MKLDSRYNVITSKDNGARLSTSDCCITPALRSKCHTAYNISRASPDVADAWLSTVHRSQISSLERVSTSRSPVVVGCQGNWKPNLEKANAIETLPPPRLQRQTSQPPRAVILTSSSSSPASFAVAANRMLLQDESWNPSALGIRLTS
jgi:hypothetical protein